MGSSSKVFSVIAGIILLSLSCKKQNIGCSKEGYEYINSTASFWHDLRSDSIAVGNFFTLNASAPKRFRDELTNMMVMNTSPIIRGSLGVGVIIPGSIHAAADNFIITADIGSVVRDSINFSEGQLKGFRTLLWDGTDPDSFRIQLTIVPATKGIYNFAFRQQSYKDKDCALFKYFPTPGNVNQYLHYWEQYLVPPSDLVKSATFCIKVY